jgi:hypothetical protein
VLGTCVIGGMLAASFLIPVCYYVVEKLLGKKRATPQAEAPKVAADAVQ